MDINYEADIKFVNEKWEAIDKKVRAIKESLDLFESTKGRISLNKIALGRNYGDILQNQQEFKWSSIFFASAALATLCVGALVALGAISTVPLFIIWAAGIGTLVSTAAVSWRANGLRNIGRKAAEDKNQEWQKRYTPPLPKFLTKASPEFMFACVAALGFAAVVVVAQSHLSTALWIAAMGQAYFSFACLTDAAQVREAWGSYQQRKTDLLTDKKSIAKNQDDVAHLKAGQPLLRIEQSYWQAKRLQLTTARDFVQSSPDRRDRAWLLVLALRGLQAEFSLKVQWQAERLAHNKESWTETEKESAQSELNRVSTISVALDDFFKSKRQQEDWDSLIKVLDFEDAKAVITAATVEDVKNLGMIHLSSKNPLLER